MSASGIKLNPYDEVPFPSQPLPQTLPDRLAAVGILFGMTPPPANRCRVLELGCATGGNLLPMAEHFPDSQFVGVDYARGQVQAAERAASLLQMRNIELHHADIGELGDSLGQFDYILCHGVYSWISDELQQKIMQLIERSLAEHGIAYISYNTHPGWYLRLVLRELMLDHAHSAGTAISRLARGRALLEFIAKAGGRQQTPYGELLKLEAESILKHPDGYVYHEYFESDNRPLYFHEFIAHAHAANLQYLGEAAVATMFASNFGPKIEGQLKALSTDLISNEQHLDLIRMRGFRQTLLCHRNVPLRRHILPERLESLYFHGRVVPQNPNIDVTARDLEVFKTPHGLTLSTPAPGLKAALCLLNDAWPRSLSFQEIFAGVAVRLGASDPSALPPNVREGLGQNLIQCVASGLLDINSQPDAFTTTISERPQGSRVARAEARTASKVTNRRNEIVDLDESARNVLVYLDGQQDRTQLMSELMAAVDRGEISILKSGIPASQGKLVQSVLESMLEESLKTLAANALLVK